MRQAVFDMIMHAPWGGHALLDGACVLDAFAGTGALGLEALSRGAARAVFMDRDKNALAALHANIEACDAGGHAEIVAADVLRPPPGPGQTIVFLDPPYGEDLIMRAVATLRAAGWIVGGSVIIAENRRLGQVEHNGITLAHKVQGAAQVNVWREP